MLKKRLFRWGMSLLMMKLASKYFPRYYHQMRDMMGHTGMGGPMMGGRPMGYGQPGYGQPGMGGGMGSMGGYRHGGMP